MTDHAQTTHAHHHLVRASDVTGLPVVTIDGGEDAAEIKDVIYDSRRHELVGFTLNKRGWFRGNLKQVLTAEHVAGIGRDAVMVESDTALTDLGDAPAPLVSSDGNDVMGNEVVSSDGTVLGKVVDVIIETGAAPAAVGYEVEASGQSVFVPTSAQLSVSGDNLVVPPEATEFIGNDLAGFGASVQGFRARLRGERS